MIAIDYSTIRPEPCHTKLRLRGGWWCASVLEGVGFRFSGIRPEAMACRPLAYYLVLEFGIDLGGYVSQNQISSKPEQSNYRRPWTAWNEKSIQEVKRF